MTKKKEKWLAISIYRPQFRDNDFSAFFNKSFSHSATKYDSPLIMGYFNMEANNSMFKSFSDSNKLSNLIKNNNCFKG